MTASHPEPTVFSTSWAWKVDTMTWTCSVCHKPIQANEKIDVRYPLFLVTVSQKSGHTFLVPQGDPTKPDYVHDYCIPGYNDPNWNDDVSDSLRKKMKAELRDELLEEEYEDMYQRAMDEALQEVGGICRVCGEPIEER